VDVNISGSRDYVGGLIGHNGGHVVRCYSTGTVVGVKAVGGLAGGNSRTIARCHSIAQVIGSEEVGGLTGSNEYGHVTDCHSAGVVDGSNDVGGLVGRADYGAVTYCYSMGTVNGRGSRIGGLVGSTMGDVTCCYSSAAIGGTGKQVGGLVGCVWGPGAVTHCYSSGPVSGNSTVGGLVGANSATTTCCYSTGVVTGDSSVGGLIGSGGASGCFWDIETSGQTTSAAGTGLATARMQRSATFALWADPVHGAIWKVDEGNDYPRLLWEEDKPGQAIVPVRLGDSLAGLGTADDPYQIETPTQFNLIGRAPWDWDKHFKLMADIDMSGPVGTEFNIIGIDPCTPFTGVFDGNDHAISNFRHASTNSTYIGLFGYVADPNAQIRNLGLIDPNVEAAGGSNVGSLVGYLSAGTISGCYVEGGGILGGSNVGGLVGWSSGTISGCCSTAGVTGDTNVGGLVGGNGGDITTCYTAAAVAGASIVGGLAGLNSGAITSCFADTSVTGTETLGGLAGSNGGTVRYCHATGDVTGNQQVGGLVGSNGNVVINSFSTGVVAGGGLVGQNTVAQIPHAWDRCFRLVSDVDLSEFADEFNPIGMSAVPFKGTFDGDGQWRR